MCMFRDLTAGDVECRIGMCKENGLQLLLYKDARVDMNILDESVGQERWQREHYEVKGNLYCRVGIRFESGWVWKADCGTESNTEEQKGEASDSFKRACVNWGIGRELYTAPYIWIPVTECTKITPPANGKGSHKCSDSFTVTELEIKNKTIVGLAIRNDKTKKICFTYGTSRRPENAPMQQPSPTVQQTSPTPSPEQQGLPFPDVPPRTTTTPAPSILVGSNPRPMTEEEQRQWALDYIPESSPIPGIRLGDLYKMDKQAFAELRATPPSVNCAKAIQIIDAWISAHRNGAK